MARHFALLVASVSLALLYGGQLFAAPVAAAATLRISAPANVSMDTTFAVSLRLPAGTTAFEGRVLLDSSAAEVVGLAPLGGGVALPPGQVNGGYRVAAYALPTGTAKTIQIIVAPRASGRLDMRLVIDATADKQGRRLTRVPAAAFAGIVVGSGGQEFKAPPVTRVNGPTGPATAPRDLVADGVMGKMDLDQVRAAWLISAGNADPCTGSASFGDANGDGCVDVVDLQAMAAAQGQRVAGARVARTGDTIAAGLAPSVGAPGAGAANTTTAAVAASVPPNLTFTVNSTADTPDATNGDGLCADSQGRCTLRAAITESNWDAGDNRIEFNLPGTAPITIQVGSNAMSLIQDRTGALVIDGYTQPGSQVNTSTTGSNAIPGVLLRGTGDNPRGLGLYVSSANNVIRGLALVNNYHGLMLDTTSAHNNSIVGDWFGMTSAAAADSYVGHDGVIINNGANHNKIGSPALADANVSRATKALYMYGQGTDYNVLQNNFLCMTPNGTSTAVCNTGIDHDFGPKNNLDGGTNPNERNVIGETYLNGIEVSHGYSTIGGSDADQYNDKFNQLIGNWIGFRGDGSYSPSFASAQLNPGSGDNGNAINIYDGSAYNVASGNYISSIWDGIQTASPNSTGNTISGNFIGVSPLGQAAPIGRDGIVVRLQTRTHTVEGNTIRNVGRYGIGLIEKDVRYVKVTKNIITDMSGTPIFYAPDPNNPTVGADDLVPAPSITTATTASVTGTGIVGATVEVYKASRPAGQSGLPQAYLGSGLVAGDGTWQVSVALQVGDNATALQILPNGDTSPLSLNVSSTFERPPDAPTPDFTYRQNAGTTDVQFSDGSTGSPASWKWAFGDGVTSTEQNPLHSYAASGDYTVSLTATNAGGSNTISKTVTVNPATTAHVVASDTFSRTTTGGWGTAEVGGDYTVAMTAANYSTDGSVGSMQVPNSGGTRSALLSSVSIQDVDMRFRVSTDKPANGKMFVYAVVRQIGNYEYRPRIVINSDESISVGASLINNGAETIIGQWVAAPGVIHAAGVALWMHVQVTGTNPTTIRVKVWNDGQTEPSAWQFTGSNGNATLQAAGAIGIRSHLDTSVSNAPVTFSFDDLTAATTSSDTSVAADMFFRTVNGGWGTADLGGNYSIVGGQGTDYNVAGGVGTMNLRTAGTTRSVLLPDVKQLNVDEQFRVALSKLPTAGRVIVYAVARQITTNEYRARLWINSDGSISVNASVLNGGKETALGAKVDVPGVSAASAAFVWIDIQVSGANPTTVNVRAWADGQTEPTTWQFSATDSTASTQVAGSVGMRTWIDVGVSNVPITAKFDDYSVVATK